MLTILTDTDSFASQFLYELRHKDIQIDRGRFRNNMKKLGQAMALKMSEVLEYREESVVTPLGVKEMRIPAELPVLITILRAGNAFLTGFQDIFEESDTGFIGAFRLEGGDDPQVSMGYAALPETSLKKVFLIDPMLATGKSMIQAYEHICKAANPAKIYFTSAVAAPEGISYIQQHCKHSFEIWSGSVDERLDERAYIYPGLGDAGDLSFGKKI